MSSSKSVFMPALQSADIWIKAVGERLGTDDPHAAYAALRAALHVLRDRLPLEAVLGLSAQMPMLVRGLMLEGWCPQHGPTNLRDRDEFTDAVAERLPLTFPGTGFEAAEAVLGGLEDLLDPGEVRKIANHLPARMSMLFASLPALRTPLPLKPGPSLHR